MELLWHKPFAQSWLDRRQHGRLPHAVLLIGPKGLGKRAAAAWIAAQQLQADAHQVLPHYPFERPAHADLHWIEPPEDKQAIGIDQIRELVADLSLTSFHGGGKVAVIDPANAMTISAANSLLKTLEEPPGDTTLILIADRTGRLPATLFSRCQRIDFAPPSEADGLAWLDRLQPGASWLEALRVAGFAPLAAIAAAEELAKEGINCEVIDLLSISPIDYDHVIDSVKRTHRLVVVDEDTPICSIASEICAMVADEAFDYLDAPPSKVTAPHTPVPYSRPLENLYVPNAARVVKTVQKLIIGEKVAAEILTSAHPLN